MNAQERKRIAKEWGQKAEDIAAEYLSAQGYVVRERNWSPRGAHVELDIISQSDNTIIFVEVKARSGNYEDPADAVDERKIRRIARAADAYLRLLPDDFEYRFDIITVSGNASFWTLDHIPDAFLPPLS